MKSTEIKELRQQLGHTQVEFAKKVGLGTKGTTISRWENGVQRPHPVFVDKMKQIAKESR